MQPAYFFKSSIYRSYIILLFQQLHCTLCLIQFYCRNSVIIQLSEISHKYFLSGLIYKRFSLYCKIDFSSKNSVLVLIWIILKTTRPHITFAVFIKLHTPFQTIVGTSGSNTTQRPYSL